MSMGFSTPKQAVQAMRAAGAVFTVRRRDDSLNFSFSYRVTDGGDIDRCKQILAFAKSRPPQFFEAFRAAVQEGAETPSIHPNREGDVPTSPSIADRGAA